MPPWTRKRTATPTMASPAPMRRMRVSLLDFFGAADGKAGAAGVLVEPETKAEAATLPAVWEVEPGCKIQSTSAKPPEYV